MTFLYPALGAGLPLLVISFLLIAWAIKKNYALPETDELDEQELETEKDSQEVNPFYKKWLFFGGGFYGLMAFITYIHVEALEIYGFFSQYTSLSALIDQISVSALISLLVESFLNLIPAFTWFLYWPKQVTMENGWHWLLAAYIGYQMGAFLAKRYFRPVKQIT